MIAPLTVSQNTHDKEYVLSKGYHYIACSARKSTNVDEAFTHVARECLHRQIELKASDDASQHGSKGIGSHRTTIIGVNGKPVHVTSSSKKTNHWFSSCSFL
jgi:hypothetical protein